MLEYADFSDTVQTVYRYREQVCYDHSFIDPEPIYKLEAEQRHRKIFAPVLRKPHTHENDH